MGPNHFRPQVSKGDSLKSVTAHVRPASFAFTLTIVKTEFVYIVKINLQKRKELKNIIMFRVRNDHETLVLHVNVLGVIREATSSIANF